VTEVIPALAKLPWETTNAIDVDTTTANEIRADCVWYIDPKSVDATAGDCSMLRQINAALGY